MTTTITDPKTEKKLQRQKERDHAKRLLLIEAQKNQKPVKSLTITIEWRKSRMWGMNPHATGQVVYKDGVHERFFAKASGYGYDKKSQVIADLFNQVLKYRLWDEAIMSKAFEGRRPYGIFAPKVRDDGLPLCPHFEGGIGAECYRDISEYIGGKWEQIVNTPTCDVFRYEEASK